MDLRQLDHFVAVAEEHNFTRAAQRIHIVQSALSTSIRGLEDELGTPLFNRNARKVTLTPAGEIMLERARRVLNEVREAREAVAGIDGLLVGTLSVCIGLIQCINPYLAVVDMLAQFHAQHPGVHIRFRQMPAEPALEELRMGHAEIMLTVLPRPLPGGFKAHCLARDRLAFICRRAHPYANHATVAAEDLRTEMFVDLTRQWFVRAHVDDYFGRAGFERNTSCEVNELTTLFDLVRSGLGVAIVPHQLAKDYDDEIAVIELSPSGLDLEYGAIVALDRAGGKPRLGAASRAFMTLIEATSCAAALEEIRK